MRWLYQRFGFNRKDKVNADYFKGLNFLLNEETDKAIEAFIRALEVDNETVELHLALGGLFRRKGQLDRATRLHQNLIARPNLTERQRFEAIHELAQDYYKVGWLDRAEGLFDELKGSEAYYSAAVNGLCRIYQQEKEWQQAIDILNQHKPGPRADCAKQIAHYYCELAEIALENLDFDAAKQHLKKAEFGSAIKHWQTLQANNATALQLVAGKMIRSYQEVDDKVGLSAYLKGMSAIPKHGQDFRAWYDALVVVFGDAEAQSHVFGDAEAQSHVLKCVESEGLSGPVANHLHHAVVADMVSDDSMSQLLKELLNRAKSRKIEYTCTACGFDTKSMYWYCQNCGEWESFK